MSIEAMKQALEALKRGRPQIIGVLVQQDQDAAITSLRQAIEQAEKQEPVAWLSRRYVDNFPASGYETAQPTDYGAFPVYTTPQPQREWVGLTDEEIEIVSGDYTESEGFKHGARWALDQLKEKQ